MAFFLGFSDIHIGKVLMILQNCFECNAVDTKSNEKYENGILLPKLFWPNVRKKKCSSDREKLLKFEAEGKILRSIEQFIQTGQNNFW